MTSTEPPAPSPVCGGSSINGGSKPVTLVAVMTRSPTAIFTPTQLETPRAQVDIWGWMALGIISKSPTWADSAVRSLVSVPWSTLFSPSIEANATISPTDHILSHGNSPDMGWIPWCKLWQSHKRHTSKGAEEHSHKAQCTHNPPHKAWLQRRK